MSKVTNMSHKLSLRLQTCLDCIAPLQVIADIGTDHAYLPCAGILNNQLTRAIASDIGDGPLQVAKATVNRYHLHESIELRLGAGLTTLKAGEVEGVVIAGMGGSLMQTILAESATLTKSFKRLVLQPNIDAFLVRQWLARHNFNIINEKIIAEDHKIYEIIVAQPGTETGEYSLLDLEFGPILRQSPQDEVFKLKWEKNLRKLKEILNELPEHHPRTLSLEKQKQQIEEVLK